MAFYDDKRFILSHIKNSFVTCDDTGICETVMAGEPSCRYPFESVYHHPFDYNSDDEFDFYLNDNKKELFKDEDLSLLRETDLDYKSELLDDEQLSQSLEIMSESYDMGLMRRRSNTAQRLERLKKEKKNQSKTKVVNWKSFTQVVETINDDNSTQIKRIIPNVSNLTDEEIKMLEYNEKENVYFETEEYRKWLFPMRKVDNSSDQSSQQKTQTELVSKKSALSRQIEQSTNTAINPFNEFTRFDGRVSDDNAHTKRIRIFFKIHENDPEFKLSDFTKKFDSSLSMSNINCGSNWIEIIVLANARVCDLIGLICWHYTFLQIGPPLKSDFTAYALKIAEENGEVDNDFPSLTFTDEIRRYGFPYLALVEVEMQVSVTVFIDSEDVFSTINVTSPTTTLRDVLEQLIKKRHQIFRSNNFDGNYSHLRLELRSHPGVTLDLNSQVFDHTENSKNVEFSLIFLNNLNHIESLNDLQAEGLEKNSNKNAGLRLNKSISALDEFNSSNSQKKRNRNPNDFSSNMFDLMKAHLYQSFEVNIVSKLYNTPVEMGISETKVEITPKNISKSPSSNHFTDRILSKLQKIKAMNVNVEDVCECDLVPTLKQIYERKTFKLVIWNGNEFKSLKFEGDLQTIDDIVFKLKHVMRMRTSARRREYDTIKQRKQLFTNKASLKARISSGSSSSGSEENLDSFTGLIDGDSTFKNRDPSKLRRHSKQK